MSTVWLRQVDKSLSRLVHAKTLHNFIVSQFHSDNLEHSNASGLLSVPCLEFIERRPSSVAAAALLASMEMVRLPPSAADWFRSLPLGLDDGTNDAHECLALFRCLVECNDRLRPRVVFRRGREERDGAKSEAKAKKNKGAGRRVSPTKCRPKKR